MDCVRTGGARMALVIGGGAGASGTASEKRALLHLSEAVSIPETQALQGRYRTAQGVSPGNRGQTKSEPCKGGAEACFAPTGLSYRT